ncbi:PTS mannitol transporter subunit IICB [Tessaracoccus sp. OH4464_COT-324]|uniref:PTS mannitol transporter subunit IICB n=1 Tax=Tessaracoccus sp. OH4464_COT-324 TaxID=2491059 RepID=UPI001319CF66|nr:PTS mannitol transporter subunit IICB [Tessaracoccus sp. OH4464_COT-324]
MSLPDASVHKNLTGKGARARIQRFGGHLAGMIMPNIGAFIAWGLLTAIFIPDGWLPNEALATMVGPVITYLLPILIGYTGGKMVHETRGAVAGAIATMGVVVGSDVPMFLGAMMMGPLAAFVLKLFDRAVAGRVRSGFEMLVDNFSLGILGMLMAILGRLGIGPLVDVAVKGLGSGVGWLVEAHLLPIASIVVEPAKVLFLNNAINHGVLSPLGAAESQELGRSILFMVESNPGPGLGILLALTFFGTHTVRATAPGAIIIHFFGGIHEIYFPYILAMPRLILAAISGGASGLLVGTLLNAGLVGPASPGSIFAYFAVTPRGGYIPMLAAVLTATAVSFLVAAALLGFRRQSDPVPDEEADGLNTTDAATRGISGADVNLLYIACDAGMGSSVMVASAMRKRLAPHGVDVRHSPVNEVPSDAQLIMCQSGLAERVRGQAPAAVIVPFEQFVGDPAFARVEEAIKEGKTIE